MRKIILLVFVLCTINIFAEKITVVTEEWPPYVISQDEGASGFDYEVTKAVIEKMGYELDFQFFPWKRCIAMMKQKHADAILDVSFNNERKEFMHFPEEILSVSNTVLFYKKDRDFKYEKIEDLKGLVIGSSLGYNYSEEFDNSELFAKEEVKEHEVNFKKLLNDRVDLFIVNKNVGLYTAKKMGILDELSYTSKPISGGDLYLAFSKKDGNDKLAELFSKTLKEFKQSEEYKNILKNYGQKQICSMNVDYI